MRRIPKRRRKFLDPRRKHLVLHRFPEACDRELRDPPVGAAQAFRLDAAAKAADATGVLYYLVYRKKLLSVRSN